MKTFRDMDGRIIENGDVLLPCGEITFSRLCSCIVEAERIKLCDILNSIPVEIVEEDLTHTQGNNYCLFGIRVFVRKNDWEALLKRMWVKIETPEFQTKINEPGNVPQNMIDIWIK
jgi:hypothetical protein